MKTTTCTALTLALAALIGSSTAAQAQSSSNKLMTREELRACMKMQDGIKATAASIETRKAALTADKGKIAQANAELKTLRDELGKPTEAVKQADAALREHSAGVDAWKAELQELETSKMKTAERRKKQLLDQREELDAKGRELQAKRSELIKTYDAAVNQFNARAKAVEALSTDWNQRNENLANEGDVLIDTRATYAADCASRRFREDDEIAIKAGK